MFALDQQSVEMIKRGATKLVRVIKDLLYDVHFDRLCNLNVPPLMIRYQCIIGDLIYTYKLYHNFLDSILHHY